MNDFFGTLKGKLGPLPVYVWAGLGTIALALYLMRKKSKNANQTNAAADQTNSDLGSAAELANMFEVAGLMPYQGGNVYVNTTVSGPPPVGATTPTGNGHGTTPPPTPTPSPVSRPAPTTGPIIGPGAKPQAIYRVKTGDTLTSIAKKYGVSEANLWAYNITPGVRPAATIATLKSRGQNKLFANEEIDIPQKSWRP